MAFWRLLIALGLYLSSLLTQALPTIHHGRGTIFGPWWDGQNGDPLAGRKAACDYAPRRAGMSRESLALFRKGDFVASKKHRCGTILRVWSAHSGRSRRLAVVDKGPRLALLDIWFVAAQRLGHDGGRIFYVVED